MSVKDRADQPPERVLEVDGGSTDFDRLLQNAEHNVEKTRVESVKDNLFGPGADLPAELVSLLTPKQQIAAIALASGLGNITEVARRARISRRVLYLWAAKPEFKRAVKLLQLHFGIRTIEEEFRRLIPRAVEVTEEVMNDSAAPSSTRLEAAAKIIDRVLGRPQQPVEHRGSLLKQVISEMDAQSTTDHYLTNTPGPKDDPESIH